MDENISKCLSKAAFVYGLVDPRDGLVHYVGLTMQPTKRMKQHLSDEEPCSKVAWINDLKSLGLYPQMKILEECSCEKVREVETYWIDFGLSERWPLTNRSQGGEGAKDMYYKIDSLIKNFSLLTGNKTIEAEIRALPVSEQFDAIMDRITEHSEMFRLEISQRLTG